MRAPNAFGAAAEAQLRDAQMRRNIDRATATIRARRAAAIAERPDWEQLRDRGQAIKERALARLPELLVELEARLVAHGAEVHWARDGAEANAIIIDLVRRHDAGEVLKVKSMTTEEIGLNAALAAAGIRPVETDLAELIVQLAGDRPSHLLVPAIHRNRGEIRDLFRAHLPGAEHVSDDPEQLTAAARAHLRRRFVEARVAISGANFAVADTGTLCVVESEGNGRLCTSLPDTLITVMGIEKVVADASELAIMLQLLARSATGEALSPYTSLWSGAADGDGPRHVHLVLLDAGRSATRADAIGRQALHCIRCSACVNVCPVYGQTGGHAYNSPYAGPIGAILTPQLSGLRDGASLPFASTLCGACYDVCPVKIDIPEVLVHLRGRVVAARAAPDGERAAMGLVAHTLLRPALLRAAQRLTRWALGRAIVRRLAPALPGALGRWSATRDLPDAPAGSFRDWWRGRPG